ncbi:MAG: hypothetical protein KC636_21990 [Myxococcales bacterium]|nr:hypothetical protein [Myxococcales bacterium]
MYATPSRLWQTFNTRHVVLSLIHVRESQQALRSARVALHSGADGVFLMSDALADARLLEIHAELSPHFPGWWIGVHGLDLTQPDVFARLSSTVAGLWSDDAGIDARASDIHELEVDHARRASGWKGLYFGGVALASLPAGALDPAAVERVDIVTLRGATGQPPSIDAIRGLLAELAPAPLAVAGEFSSDNIDAYLDHVRCFVITAASEHPRHALDRVALARLVERVRAHDGQSRHVGQLPFGMGLRARLEPAFAASLGTNLNRVRLVDLTHGPVFELDVAAFPEDAPRFAYYDDSGAQAEAVAGLVDEGHVELELPSGRGTLETRRCQLFRATRADDDARARLRSRTVGEFWAELYHVADDGPPELLWRDDFCLK